MSKVRINDLARELEVKSKAILDALPLVGVAEKKTHSSSLEDHEAEKVRAHIRGSAEAQSSSARSARTLRGEEEIKTKIDLSHISRPGDVLEGNYPEKGSGRRAARSAACSADYRGEARGCAAAAAEACGTARSSTSATLRAGRPSAASAHDRSTACGG